jgi:hypothetical protein
MVIPVRAEPKKAVVAAGRERPGRTGQGARHPLPADLYGVRWWRVPGWPEPGQTETISGG